MVLNFAKEKSITVRPAEVVTTKQLTVMRMIDLPLQKLVRVVVKELHTGPITLWSGSEYDKMGQWTDTDVQKRLTELYGA